MDKARVVIVDMDFEYIVPLQQKFIEEFFNKIQLEVITDRAVFQEVLKSPQKIDVLILAENFYTEELQRHNVKHVFVMMASDEKENYRQNNIFSLFKYTSIKEIFNKMVGECEELRAVKARTNMETQLVVVSSACGGAGKTSIAMGLATSLAKQFKRVLYINASRLQTFHTMLEETNPITDNAVYSSLSQPQQNYYECVKPYLRAEAFSYLPPFKMPLLSLGLPVSVYRDIAVSAKQSGDFDVIIMDLPSVFDEELVQLFQLANRVLLLTHQTEKAVFSLNCLMRAVNNATSEKYLFVCNEFDRNKPNALQDSAIEKRFAVSEYIEVLPYFEQAKAEDFAKIVGVKRISMLVL